MAKAMDVAGHIIAESIQKKRLITNVEFRSIGYREGKENEQQ